MLGWPFWSGQNRSMRFKSKMSGKIALTNYLFEKKYYFTQFLKRKIHHNSISGVISEGSCVDICILSTNVTCCSSDLCNAYSQEAGQKKMLLSFSSGNINHYSHHILKVFIIYSAYALF